MFVYLYKEFIMDIKLIPVGGPGVQDYLVIDKDEKGTVTQRKILDVRYVPLTDKEKQWPADL
jgi:protein-L-isoaspartate O-methyltransferase